MTPLLTNKNYLIKNNNNFTDILRARLNHSSDFDNRNISFEKLNFGRNNDGNNFLYKNKIYNYKGNNNVLKNNLYEKILEKNKENKIAKANNNNKQYSIINKNIYNAIKNINNKRNKAFTNSVLSLEANQIIQNFNAKYKIKENVIKN